MRLLRLGADALLGMKAVPAAEVEIGGLSTLSPANTNASGRLGVSCACWHRSRRLLQPAEHIPGPGACASSVSWPWVAFGGGAGRPGKCHPWRPRLPMLAAALPRRPEHGEEARVALWQGGGMVASLLGSECWGRPLGTWWGALGASPVLLTPWSAMAVAPPER